MKASAQPADRTLLRTAGRVVVKVGSSSLTSVAGGISEDALLSLVDVLAARPDDGLLGEEGSSREGTSGVRWVVDPIDGTVNFLYGFPQYAISIAAELDGEIVAGVVVDAATRDEYHAGLGLGAWCDGVRLTVRPTPPLAERLVLTGFNYDAAVRRVQAAGLAEAFTECLHARVRRDLWGYAADETLGPDDLIRERYRGIRPAFGYPACPDHLPKRRLFDLLGAEEIGMEDVLQHRHWTLLSALTR